MKKKIVLATKNKGKIREFNHALAVLGLEGCSVAEIVTVEDPIEDGKSFLENSLIKAKYYAKHTNLPCLADDSGIVVDALNGEPGIYSARYAGEACDDEANNKKVVANLKDTPFEKRTCAYVCSLALVYPNGEVFTAEGRCEGIFQSEPKGDDGFGYDPYFYLPKYDKTMAEISIEEKNLISHRGKALEILVEKLKNA